MWVCVCVGGAQLVIISVSDAHRHTRTTRVQTWCRLSENIMSLKWFLLLYHCLRHLCVSLRTEGLICVISCSNHTGVTLGLIDMQWDIPTLATNISVCPASKQHHPPALSEHRMHQRKHVHVHPPKCHLNTASDTSLTKNSRCLFVTCKLSKYNSSEMGTETAPVPLIVQRQQNKCELMKENIFQRWKKYVSE